MAIQKMQYVTLMAPIDRFDWIVEHCIVPYTFEPVRTVGSGHFVLPFDDENPYDKPMENIEYCLNAAGITPEAALAEANSKNLPHREIPEVFRRELDELWKRRKEINEAIAQKQELLGHILPLKQMDVPFDQLFSMKFIDVQLGRMPLSSYQKLETYGNEAKVVFLPVVTEKNSVFGIAFMAHSEHESGTALLTSLYFQRVFIPKEVHEDPETTLRQTEEVLAQLTAELAVAEQEIEALIQKHRAALCALYAQCHYLQSCFDLRKYAHKSDAMFRISGWLPQRQLAKLKKTADSDDDIILVAENPRDNPELEPPTHLKNPPILRFFQMFVEMYGLPSYGEVDPTCLVAITYTVFFGIMFGDLGQGLALCLVGLFMWFKMKMQLGKIISVIGVASAIAGLFYGSVFGKEDIIHGFVVLEGNNTLYILLFAAAFGMVLIALAMGLNIFNGLRARDPGRWLLSPNGIMGGLLFFGNVAAGLTLLLAKKNLWTPWYLTVTTFIPLVALFLAGPLTRLLRGEKDWLPKKFGEFFAESFFELFEVVLSYMSNAISYVRIGAFAISHAGMMLVVTNMAQMSSDPVTQTVVMIFGNIFVIGLEGLIVGIQCLRLQFYEFFSRFYSGSGRAFKPLNLRK